MTKDLGMSMAQLQRRGIRLYNLFPRLFGSMSQWKDQVGRIADMGFNAIYVNPFHYPGFSGSLYSPKDYFKFNPLFIDHDHSHLSPSEQLADFIRACHSRNLLMIMDLVINHTAIDCTLIDEHPAWYKRGPDGEIAHPGAWNNGKWVEWGDLAEIDNAHSGDRENLWQFWWRMMAHYLDLGVDGFRCDAAYQVPQELWYFVIEHSRQKQPGCLFLAESLGCSFRQVEELARVGFDYLFNSSKYWDFNQPWGMEQYEKTNKVVSTISFPESHDTERLMTEMNGDVMAVKRQIIFAVLFSRGIMIPSGFEYGFRRRLNVVDTQPSWWESTEVNWTEFLRSLLIMKSEYEVLNHESGLEIVNQDNWSHVFCFRRSMPGHKTVMLVLNKDRRQHQRVFIPDLERVLGLGKPIDISPEFPMEKVPRAFEYFLRPSETKILTTA